MLFYLCEFWSALRCKNYKIENYTSLHGPLVEASWYITLCMSFHTLLSFIQSKYLVILGGNYVSLTADALIFSTPPEARSKHQGSPLPRVSLQPAVSPSTWLVFHSPSCSPHPAPLLHLLLANPARQRNSLMIYWCEGTHHPLFPYCSLSLTLSFSLFSPHIEITWEGFTQL